MSLVRLIPALGLSVLIPIVVACSGGGSEPGTGSGGLGTEDRAGDGTASGGSAAGSGSASSDGGSPAGTGASSSVGGSGGGEPAAPPDCSGITAAGFELCESGADFCGAVFTDTSGCTEVCAAAGLACEAGYEDVDGQCAPDQTLPALPCDSGHQSDYCRCSGPEGDPGAGGTGGAPSGGGGTSGGGTGSTSGGGTGGTSGGGTGGTPSTGVVGTPIGFATLNGGTKGGQGGQTVTVTTLAALKQYAESSTPYVILVQGTISNGSSGGQVNVKSNKSIVGIGSSAFLQGVGIQINNSNNVILQNLKITLVGTTTPGSVNGGDAIVINGTSKNVWLDHCEVYSEDPTVQTNIDKYDGLLDIRDQTGFITVSWSYFHDHHKGCLVGASDSDLNDDRKVTYHHNYFKKIVKRMPMYRGSVGHFFNNYINGVPTTEATFVVKDTCLRVEKNVYENVKYAIYSGDVPGKAERIDNIGSQSRAWPASCTVNIPYEYASVLTTTTSDVKTVVPAGAGVGKL